MASLPKTPAPPFRLIFDKDLDANTLKSLALGPDEYLYPTPENRLRGTWVARLETLEGLTGACFRLRPPDGTQMRPGFGQQR